MQQVPNNSYSNIVVPFQTEQDFLTYLGKAIYIENPLIELANSPTAIVYYGTKCCNLRCCVPCSCVCECKCDCADYFKYNTLTVIDGQKKYLFKNIVKLKCNICCTDVINRFEYCKDFSMTSYDQYNKLDSGVETAEMVNETDCICFGVCEALLRVLTKPDGQLAGYVRFKGVCCKSEDCCKCKCDCKCNCKCNFCDDCCYLYYYCCDILSPNKELIYTIYIKKCCLSFIPIGCCGQLDFVIKDSMGNKVGTIEGRGNCCYILGICGANYNYTIYFPKNATPEMKLTIINAVIAIDMIYV